MDKDQYVKKIVKKIQCDGAKKKEIEKQLRTEIEDRLQQGQSLTEIMEQMGPVEEIAADFNETLSEQEKKRYGRGKIWKIVLTVVAVVLLAAGVIGWFLFRQMPRTYELKDSKYFKQEQVEEAMYHVIDLWDAEDYESLRELSTDRMASLMQKEKMDEARANLAPDWGDRRSMGNLYPVEIVQNNKHYAVGEIMVVYENTETVFRLTFDEEMKLCGMYFR